MTCPDCAGPVDNVGRCWRCCNRPCVVCGKATGTAFIQVCVVCENSRARPAPEATAPTVTS
jgi:hypothetical protein